MNASAPHPWERFDAMFEQGYMKHLRRQLNSIVSNEKAENICNAVISEAEKVFTANLRRITDKPSQGHILMTSYVLASYRVLQQRIDDVESIKDIIEKAFCEPGRIWIQWAMRLSLLFAQDKMKMIVGQTDKSAASYGKSTVIENQGDGISFYSSNVKRCGYHEFFKANGTPELTRLFCAWDKNWAAEIKPDKHGIKFSRPTTIAAGDDMCRFEFRRLNKKIGGT